MSYEERDKHRKLEYFRRHFHEGSRRERGPGHSWKMTGKEECEGRRGEFYDGGEGPRSHSTTTGIGLFFKRGGGKDGTVLSLRGR